MMNEEEKTHKILVIDDDTGFLELVKNRLKSNGYEVVTADEAPRGLEIAMKEAVDLIILDVMMPVINGYNICRLLKSQDSHKDIPIILLTSRSTDEDQKIGHDVGADAYLLKPLDTNALLDKIKELTKNA